MNEEKNKKLGVVIPVPVKKQSGGDNSGTPTGPRKKKKKIKLWMIVLAVVVLLFAVGRLLPGRGAVRASTAYEEATVAYRDITVVLKGTGTVRPANSYQVASLVKGEVLEAPFEEGDVLKKGDLLYKVDASDVENSVNRAELALERAQNSYDDSLKELDKQEVKSPGEGDVKSLYVEQGDSVQIGTRLMDIVDSSQMVLTVYFSSADASGMKMGDAAEVILKNTLETLHGTIDSVSAQNEAGEGNSLVRKVKIRVRNPGTLTEASTASAGWKEVGSQGEGTFSYSFSRTVLAEASGEIGVLAVKEGDRVARNETLAVLSGDSLSNMVRSNELSLRDARLSLDSAYNQLEDYTITSPINGTVIEKNFKAGDTIDATSANKALAVIFDMSSLEFAMNIDELDIASISVGQEVSITADALPKKTFTGYVSKININGTSVNGVTSYPVTIVIEKPDELMPGMNVTASIICEKRENVLTVPVNAVSRGNTVQLVDKSSSEVEGAYTSVEVELGVNDDDYIEIISGLNEGDVVAYPSVMGNATTGMYFIDNRGGAQGGMNNMGGPGND